MADNSNNNKTPIRAAPPKAGVIEVDKDKELTQEELSKVVDKLDVKEQATKYFLKEKGQKTVVTKDQLAKNATIYFKDCSDGDYTIDPLTKSTKVLIEGCQNTTIVFNGKITTNMIEIWKCRDVKLEINTTVLTLQADLSHNVAFDFDTKQHFQQVVWASSQELSISFKNSTDKITTGLTHKVAEYPDLSHEIDQFIVRIFEGKILEERIIRLANGFPTTQREADEHDERERKNKIRAEEKLKKLIKSVEMKHKEPGQKKVGRNDPCPCKNGKKYKQCCGTNV